MHEKIFFNNLYTTNDTLKEEDIDSIFNERMKRRIMISNLENNML